mgnify:CR=1 FL=1|jgi:mRNA interferase MazF
MCQPEKNPHRGDIWLVNLPYTNTSVQAMTRPVIIVSNNIGNYRSAICLVVPMTTKEKPAMPTHVPFMHNGKINTALCEQVLTVSSEQLLYKVGSISNETTVALNAALEVSLALKESGNDRKTL